MVKITCIEATNDDINAEVKKIKRPKYWKLSEKEQKAQEELKAIDDILITNVNKGGEVVILDVKNHVKECER